MKANWIICGLFFLIFGHNLVSSSRVLELSDRFLDIKHEGIWFIMFYAPWCSHCKRTEPIWAHVAQALVDTNVRVGKIDCTRFTAVGQHFKIQSYPTILFIKGHQEHLYTGERIKEDLLSYATRMSAPAIQQVSQPGSFDTLKEQNQIFFTFVGPRAGSLWNAYSSVAVKFQSHVYFYATNEEIAKKHFQNASVPSILVHKEKTHYFFEPVNKSSLNDIITLNETLHQWVNEERFLTFPKITRSNFHEICQTKKYLVMAVVEENKLNEIANNELEFLSLVESIIRRNYAKYHPEYQFGWIGSPEIAHSIAMDQLPTPHLIVLNSTTYEHHIPEDEPTQLTVDAIHLFLHSISHQKAPVYGGNSFLIRLYRVFFESRRYLYDMWRGNPVLTSVLFGLPLGFLSLIVYSIFCADILDANEEDEEDEHEKNE